MKIRKSTLFVILALLLWSPIPFLYFGRLDFLAGHPLGIYAVVLFIGGLSAGSSALFQFLRPRVNPRAARIYSVLFLVVGIGVYQFSGLAPSWDCLGKSIYVSVANAAGKNCTETCTNNKLKPCSGWSTCWDKFVSCNAAGIDQDGRPCQGCCFSCTVVCEPDPADDQPPTITGSVSCSQNGSNGWCTGSSTLNLTASDPQGYTLTISGNIGGTPFTCAAGNTCSQSLPNGNGTLAYSVTASQSGLSATGETSWKRDVVNPTVTTNIPSPTGSNGWFNTIPVLVSAGGSDAHSGLASAQVSVDGGAWGNSASITADGSHTVSFRAVDQAGNMSTRTQTVNVDTTPLSSSTSTSGAPGEGGWYVSTAVTTVSASDGLSGVDHVEYNQNGSGWQNGSPITSTDGSNLISVRVYDIAGNITTESLTVNVDTVPPLITPSIAGVTGSNGWLISSGTVSAMVEDVTSGVSGGVEVSVDGGAWQSTPQLLNDGVYSLSFRAFDLAGNEGSASLESLIDTTPPEVNLALKGTLGLNGWYVSDVDASADASDGLSGLDSSDVRVNGGVWSLAETLSDGVHKVDARAIDLAGNTKAVSGVLHVDTIAPVSNFSSHSNKDVASKVVILRGKSSDATSGLKSAEISTDHGTSWTSATLSNGTWSYDWDTSTLPNGTYTILLRAIDVAGNMEQPISLSLTVANHPPKVKITDSWWIWESGEYTVTRNTFPIREIQVVISDPKGRWSPVKLTYKTNLISSRVIWDRRFGDVIAPSGNYPAVLTACDIHGNCASARGVIRIPVIAPIPSTATPSPAPTTLPTENVVKSTPSPQPEPTQTDQVVDVPSISLDASSGTGVVQHVSWVVLFIALLVLLFGTTALLDPRPKALNSLAGTINLFNKEQSKK